MADTRTAARRSYPRDVVVRVLNESYDHPILWNVPETDYLKFFTFQVV